MTTFAIGERLTHPTRMTVEDRATMLRAIAERWDSFVRILDNSRVLHNDQILDFLHAGITRYADPLLTEDEIAQHAEDLLQAVRDLNAWECNGYLPENLSDAEYSNRSADEITSLINGDIDHALAPLLYGMSNADLCYRCRRTRPVTEWVPALAGDCLCPVHKAEHKAAQQ